MRYLFTLTTGRSGTELLTKVLQGCVDTAAEHEPVPILNGRPMRYLMYGLPGARALGAYKARHIRRRAANSGASRYGDISHPFSKYGEVVVPWLGERHCTLVSLDRDPRAVVGSFVALGSIPLFTGWGQHWMGNPDWPRACLRFRPRDVYEAAAWHVFETRLRRERMAARLAGCRWTHLAFETLTDPAAMVGWLRRLDLEPDTDFEKIYARKTNNKASQKRHEVDWDAVDRGIGRCVELLGRDPFALDATAGRRVLLVGPPRAQPDELRALLASAGVELTLALAPDLAALGQRGGTEAFDLVLVCPAPELDAAGVANTLRSHAYAGPLLALGAPASEGWLEAGYDDCIPDDSKRSDLIDRIAAHLRKPGEH